MNISIPPELEQFISRQVESGKYASANDLILAAVKLLELQEQLYQGRFEELQQKILVGLESLHQGERYDGKTVIEQLRQSNRERRLQG